MKIKVTYAELRSFGNFSNARAEASVEVETTWEAMPKTFDEVWTIAKYQVQRQFPEPQPLKTRDYPDEDEDFCP